MNNHAMTNAGRSLLLIAALLIAALVMAGCGDDHEGHEDGAADPDLDACEHLESGPFADLTAAAEAMGAPSAADDHVAYRIALSDDGSGSFGGVVSIPVAEAGEKLIYLDAPVPVAVADAGGAALALEQEPGCPGAGCSASCERVQNHVAVDVELVGTYFSRLGPSEQQQVTLVHFEAEGDHAHE